MKNIKNYNKINKKKINNSSSSRTTIGSTIKQNNNNTNIIKKEDKVERHQNNINFKEYKYNIINFKIHRGKSQINIFEKDKSPNKDYFLKRINSFSKDYYKGMCINRAPSLYNNRKAISKIININRNDKTYEYQNFYNNLKLNSSRIYKNEINLIKNKNVRKINEYEKEGDKSYGSFSVNRLYNSSDISIIDNSPNNSQNISKSEIKNEEDSKDNYPLIKNNITKRILSYKINENNRKENSFSPKNKNQNNIDDNTMLMTLLPMIPYSKKNNKLFNSYSAIRRNNKDINLSYFVPKKIKTHILEIMENDPKSSVQLSSLENNIIKLKFFQNIQINNLKQLLKSDKYNIQKKIDYFKGLFNEYNDIWSKYQLKIDNYLEYLSEVKQKYLTDLEMDIKQKKDIQNNI